uniref:Beta-galactosidase beta-sandwich domain-containing protein n=1 Tax=Aegilops tauschii subsp. strangulata TaxID=200361 RepID=A0A452Z6E9_AEGTS
MATYMGPSQGTACCSKSIFRTITVRNILQFFIRSRTRGKITQRKTISVYSIYSSNISMIYDVLQAHIFETELKCVAFLVNFDKHQSPTVVFRNIPFQLAPKSISILSECRTVVFETAKVNAQYGSRTAKVVESLNDIHTWKAFKEPIPEDISKAVYTGNQLFEHLSMTKDETDYLWYIVSYEYRPSDDGQLVLLNAESRAHVLHAFVNTEYVGCVHGSHDGPGNIILNTNISLKEGQNTISLLSVMVGSPGLRRSHGKKKLWNS